MSLSRFQIYYVQEKLSYIYLKNDKIKSEKMYLKGGGAKQEWGHHTPPLL